MVEGNGMCSPMHSQLATLYSTPGTLNFIQLGGDAMSQAHYRARPIRNPPHTNFYGPARLRLLCSLASRPGGFRFKNGSARGVQSQSRTSNLPPISYRDSPRLPARRPRHATHSRLFQLTRGLTE